ncbi:MAG: branched-chain amino acid ABC transporter permease [Candidatus Nezhaarchaeales archaeon]
MASRPCGVIKETYREDMGFFEKRFHWVGITLLFLVLLTLPFTASSLVYRLLTVIMVFSITIMGLNLLTCSHLFSVMHAALMGVGAYTVGFLSRPDHLGLSITPLPFIVTLPIAGIVTAGVAMFFFLPSLRVKLFYLLFTTTAGQFIIEWLLCYITKDIPGSVVYCATMGTHLGYPLTDVQQYYVILAITVIMALFMAHIGRSPLGKALMMIGEKDYAAQVQGLGLLKYKMIAAAISGFYAGVGGGLYGYIVGMVTPEHFYYLISWEMLGVGVIVGGLGSLVWGSILGSTVMWGIATGITMLVGALSAYAPWLGPTAFGFRAILYGAVIAGILIFEPRGFAALVRKAKRFFDLWPFSY